MASSTLRVRFRRSCGFHLWSSRRFSSVPKNQSNHLSYLGILGSWDLGNSSSLAPPKSSVFYVWIQPEPKKTGILKPAHGRTPPDTTRRQRQHFWPNFSNLQVNHAQCSTISMRPGRPALFKFFCATSVKVYWRIPRQRWTSIKTKASDGNISNNRSRILWVS